MLKKIHINLLSILFISSTFINNAYPANGVIASIDTLFLPLGKTDKNDSRTVSLLYGISGFSELHENIRLTYGFRTSYYNGSIFTFPISLAYVPTSDYKFNLRPQLFIGVEPIYSTIPDFTGFKWYAHAGLALDYIFNDNWILNAGVKTYINESFFQAQPKVNALNTGVVSVNLGFGYKFQ
ncbi:MAG: hypothetical protein U0354_11265 [Candidatus Sericytochromatia bacterium]